MDRVAERFEDVRDAIHQRLGAGEQRHEQERHHATEHGETERAMEEHAIDLLGQRAIRLRGAELGNFAIEPRPAREDRLFVERERARGDGGANVRRHVEQLVAIVGIVIYAGQRPQKDRVVGARVELGPVARERLPARGHHRADGREVLAQRSRWSPLPHGAAGGACGAIDRSEQLGQAALGARGDGHDLAPEQRAERAHIRNRGARFIDHGQGAHDARAELADLHQQIARACELRGIEAHDDHVGRLLSVEPRNRVECDLLLVRSGVQAVRAG